MKYKRRVRRQQQSDGAEVMALIGMGESDLAEHR